MWARGGEESEYWLCLGHREEKWLIEPMPHSGREARKRPFAGRRARATMAARHTSDKQIRRLRPSGRAAAASAAMRTRATKATRRTGVNNASMTDDPRMMTSPPPPRDKDSDAGANNDANDDAERGAKPRAAEKADEYGTRRVRTRPPPRTATTTPTTLPTRPRSQGQPTWPTRQHRTAQSAYAW